MKKELTAAEVNLAECLVPVLRHRDSLLLLLRAQVLVTLLSGMVCESLKLFREDCVHDVEPVSPVGLPTFRIPVREILHELLIVTILLIELFYIKLRVKRNRGDLHLVVAE